MGQFIDLVGQRFGRLSVIEKAGKNKSGSITWLCKCECGKETTVSGTDLRRGHVKSCGCLHDEKASERMSAMVTTHKGTGTGLYDLWCAMKRRCSNSNSKDFKDYGGRGITVCDEWRDSFEAFRDWALATGYQDELTIDRKNVDGPYSPDNCRWATQKEQQNNRRNNRNITHDGKSMTLSEWANEAGIDPRTLWGRLKRGWSMDRAITEPVKK